jgi:pimeloyl-ACP methyl ester carboxylesterase
VLKGTFEQRGLKLPLSLNRVEKVSTRKRPQTPKKPYPYSAEEVVFENPKAGIKLAGTLTLPKEGGPFPAVVLVTGSGPQDRDESLLGHKPFLVLADHLTRKGIAVLRFDDRGVGKSKGDFAKATSADFAMDAFAAIQFLSTRKEIDPKSIGVAGHSEGGMIAPMVAAEHPDKVAFIVMLAGTGARGDAIIERQTRAIGKAAGASADQLAVSARLQKILMDTARSQPDEVAAKKALVGVAVTFAKNLNDAERKALELDVGSDEALKAAEDAAATFASPWMRFFLNHDPAPILARVKCPVLAVNGALDLQVLPDQNLPLIEKALREGGNMRFETKVFPDLNHLFQHAKTGQVGEYGQIEETFAPEVMELMSSWILGLRS